MAWLDVIVVIIVLIVAFFGLARGFLKSLLKLFGTLVTLIVSILLAKPFSTLLENWFGMSSAIGHSLEPSISSAVGTDGGSIPNFFLNKFAEILMGQNYWQNYAQGSADPAFITDFSAHIGDIIGVVISVIILYILFRIVIAILERIFDALTRNRVVGSVDRVLGLVLGLAKGFLMVGIVCVFVYLLSPAIPAFGEWVNNLLAGNPITRTIFGWMSSFTDSVLIPWFNNIT